MTLSLSHYRVLLAISLGLNLLVAGLWVGRFVERRRMLAGPPERPVLHHRPRALGPWAPVVERHRPELAARRGATRAARAQAQAALESEPFDPSALDKALTALRDETTASQEAMHRALVETARTASPAERHELARTFELRVRPKR